MHLHDFKREFEKRVESQGIKYEIGAPATEDAISATEYRLGISFHEQVRRFYLFANGFVVQSPHFEVNDLESLDYLGPDLIHLATVDHCHRLAFDTSQLNDAQQWSIVNAQTRFHVTYTMASIWSNKVWVWLDWGRRVWEEL